MPATISTVLTSARLSSWVPVNTSNVGASAVSAFAAQAPTSARRIRRRRPQRSASAMATSDTSTPARATASATPRAWSDWSKALVTASPFCESSEPQKFASRATAARAPSRPACSGVNGTGGTTGSGLTGGGGGAPASAASRRAAAWGSARRAPSQAWMRRNHVKNGTTHVADRIEAHVGASGPVDDEDHRFETRGGVRHAVDRAGEARGRRREGEVVDEGAAHAFGVGVDRDQHRAPHVRHATASPSRGESRMAQLAAGNRAPAFTLTDQHGKKVKLSDFKGKKVVVYFYPKADTPGCTTQSCALRDAEPDLKKLKAVVLGISPDTPEKQLKFDDKYGLGFPLLADTEHTVAQKYGVWGEKVNYGRKYMGIIRSAFVVDTTGKLAAAFYKISPKDTVPKVTKALEELG